MCDRATWHQVVRGSCRRQVPALRQLQGVRRVQGGRRPPGVSVLAGQGVEGHGEEVRLVVRRVSLVR